MKHRILPLVLLTLITVGLFGCATSSRQSAKIPRPRSFALAVTVNGSLQPTPEQWSTIQATFVRYLARRGWVLVTDLSLADHILRVDFTPDPEDPEGRGHARVIGIRANPTTMVASRGTAPLHGQFGYAYSFGQGWPYSNFYSSSFYGYGDLYYDGYLNGWGGLAATPIATTPTPPAHPPYRHPPDNRDYCPPEHLRPSPGFVADHHSGNIGSNPVYDHPRPPPSDHRPSGSDRSSASRADRSYSRNDAAEYRSRESYSSSNFSSSEPSYYSPTPTSSSESSSSSAASVNAAASFGSAAASTPVTVMTR